jgi:DNA-binding transcriptional LysR family regulator
LHHDEGTGFLPKELVRAELQAQLLVPVLPDWTLHTARAHAVFPSRRGQTPAVRSFLDFPGQHLRGETLVEM